MRTKITTLATAVGAILGTNAAIMPETVSAAGLADGAYYMTISNTPFNGAYQLGSDGAWNSSFTFACVPGSKGCFSNALYDDTVAQPVNGNYTGNVNDGVQGTVGIIVNEGAITGTGEFEFDTIVATAGNDFAEYGDSTGFTGSIDAAGNISLTPTGLLGSFGDFPALIDEAWNIDNFNGVTGTSVNPPTSNTAYDSFTTGSASNAIGTINGAAYDGTRAILVKAGTMGSQWDGFFGASYFEVWNVSFNAICPAATGTAIAACTPPPVPVPAAVWLFGSGLAGLAGVSLRRKRPKARGSITDRAIRFCDTR